MKLSSKREATMLARTNKTETCWLWQGGKNQAGYGTFAALGASAVHRVSYQHYVGDLIPGMQIDHLCSNPDCLNPKHLEQVTFTQNQARSKVRNRWRGWPTHCKRGHAMDELTTFWRSNGTGRQCRICQNAKASEARVARGGKPLSYQPYPNYSLKNRPLNELTAADYEKADFDLNFIEIFYACDSGGVYGQRDTMPRERELLMEAPPTHYGWDEPKPCVGCGVLMRTLKDTTDLTLKPHASQGHCVNCYGLRGKASEQRLTVAEYRQAAANRPKAPGYQRKRPKIDWTEPVHCTACSREMRQYKDKPDGRPMHKSMGVCDTCVSRKKQDELRYASRL